MKYTKVIKLTGLSALILAGGLAARSGVAVAGANQKPDRYAEEYFEARVRPLLINACEGCHGTKQQQGGLRLDSIAAMLKGNSSGAVIVPGKPELSPLIQVIHYDGKIKMPPAGKLNSEQIAVLTAWVKTGAVWPGVKAVDAVNPSVKSGEFVITDAQRKFWSFRPVSNPRPPVVKNTAWCRNPIDRFILNKLESKALLPVPDVDRTALIRRATMDLIGLPATFSELAAFVADHSPDAFSKVVDRLLASPRYGERWGRLWMDVARYADTRGYNFVDDRVYHNGYTYRDYVVRAFNEDLPYDQFVVEQLAADKLELGEDRRPLAAMGFLTLGRRFLNNPHDIIDDRIDTVCRGFLGLTVSCARCHNHKFDPISASDYYALYGVFASSTEPVPPLTISPRAISAPYEEYSRKLQEARSAYTSTLQSQISELRSRVGKDPNSLTATMKATLQAFRIGMLPTDAQRHTLEIAFAPEALQKMRSADSTANRLSASPPKLPEFAMGMVDAPKMYDPHVFLRGNPNNSGPNVSRRFLAVLSDKQEQPFANGSGRLDLARAIASKDNPLAARVYVNRVWRHHFGNGIVRTPSDFGIRGEPPTHPELLDYLATQFMDNGWSTKKLHRLIMLSHTYQLSSTTTARTSLLDPENRLISHSNRRRTDFEQLRDSLLTVSGKIDLKLGGPSVEMTTAPYTVRRTIYGFVERQNLPGLFRTFDFASPDSSSPQRFTTTVPQQALYLMNSPFMIEQVKAVASRSEFTECVTDADRTRVAYQIILARIPDASELKLGVDFLRRTKTDPLPAVAGSRTPSPSGLSPFQRFIQALMMSNEFSFID